MIKMAVIKVLAKILHLSYNLNMVTLAVTITLALAADVAPNAMARNLANRVMNHIERKESAELAKLIDPIELKKLNLTSAQAKSIICTVVIPKTEALGVGKLVSDSKYFNTGPWGSCYVFDAATSAKSVNHGIVVIYGPDREAYLSLSGLVVSNWRTEERISGKGYYQHTSERKQLKDMGMTSAYMPFNGGVVPL